MAGEINVQTFLVHSCLFWIKNTVTTVGDCKLKHIIDDNLKTYLSFSLLVLHYMYSLAL